MTSLDSNPRRRWMILAVLGVAQLMVVLDATIVNIALPSAQKTLHFTNDNRQWIVTAYALAFGSLLLLGGRLSDWFGRKWTLIAGLAGFALASAVGGAAQSFGMLVAARVIQGAFGALLAPAALSLLTNTFTEPSERAKAFGIFAALAGSGSSIGLLLGGVLTQTLSWRYCMYVNLAFAAVAVAGSLLLVHNSRPQARPRLDLPGTLAVSSGLFALVFGFAHAQTTSWGNHLTIGMLAAGVLLLAAFVALEARSKSPLLPLRVVANRNRGASFLSIGIAGGAIFAVILFLTYYLQQTRGLSPITTGLAFLPMTATIMSSAILALTTLQGRFGQRPLITTGMTLGAVGMLYLTRISVNSGLAPVAMQQGRHAARIVREHLRGCPSRAFRYRDKGSLATIGRASAVAEIKAFRLSGLLAWVTWLTVHLWYLIGFENRLLVLIRWVFSFIAHGRGACLITGQAERSVAADPVPLGLTPAEPPRLNARQRAA